MKLRTRERRRFGEEAPGAAAKELAVFVAVIALTLLLSFAFIG
jgi:Flp pilus assembly pilin Flp